MNSNKKSQPNSILYVKQFFGNFFERKSMLETLSQFLNGINVLQALIQSFQNSKGIKHQTRSKITKINRKGQFINTIQEQGKAINQNMEDLYQRLKHIFDEYSIEQKSSGSSKREITAQHTDSELYDMINDYKNQNKRQKQMIKKMEIQQSQLKKKCQKIQEERSKISHKVKEQTSLNENTNSIMKENESKIVKLTKNVEKLQLQKQELYKKIQDLVQISENIQNLEKTNTSLLQKLKISEQNERKSNKKFESIDEIIKAKIKEKDELWMKMIATKLNENTLYQKASCQVFKQFMTTIKATHP